MRISDWSSDVCSSDLGGSAVRRGHPVLPHFLRHRRRADRGLRLCPRAAGDLGGVRRGAVHGADVVGGGEARSEEHTSELQSLMRISYAVFCLKKKKYYTKMQETEKSQIDIDEKRE